MRTGWHICSDIIITGFFSQCHSGVNDGDTERTRDEDADDRISLYGVFTVSTGRHICSDLIITYLLV